jgi:hypothetical protein
MFPLFFLLLLINPSVASDTECVYTCPKEPYSISSPFLRGLQNVSGLNFLASKIAESQIKSQLNKYVNGDFEIDIDSFSALDLTSGKLKSIKIKAKDIAYEDTFISAFQAKSICDFIHIDYKSKPAKILTPINIEFNGTVTENDLNKTVQREKYQKAISTIKLGDERISLFNFKNPKVALKNDRMIIKTEIQPPGIFKNLAIPINIDTALKVADNKIQFADIKIFSAGIEIDLNASESAFEDFNPILYGLKEFKKNGTKMTIKNISIEDDKINISGILLLPKTGEENKISSEP